MKLNMFPLIVVIVSLAVPAVAAERHMMQSLVPADKLTDARVLTSPLPKSPEIVEQGKVLYDGKGLASTVMGKTETAMGRWLPS